ncbi:MAG: 50S ribosomal protein L19 [Candidatus Limnocylindrus sp.]
MDLIRTITNEQMKRDLPPIKTGDTVKVSAKVVEGNRERIQVFEGTVMRLRGGGLGLTITVRRIASGVGVERTFKVHSPRIEKIEIVRHGVSHRAQLYFLRDRVGKQSSLREKRAEVGEILNPVYVEPVVEQVVEPVVEAAVEEVAVAEAPSAKVEAAVAAEEPVAPAVEAAAPVAEPVVAAEIAPAAEETPAEEPAVAAADDSEQAKA